MTFDGVASIQARIAQIEQIIAGAASNTPAAGTSSAAAGGSASSSSQFATLLQDAMAASTAGSDPLAGASAGASGSGDPLAALTGSGSASTGVSGIISELTQLAQQGKLGASSALSPIVGGGSNSVAQQFLSEALAQQGKPYVYGTTNVNDPNPKSFDCEGLVKWAAAHVGISMPSGATAQYVYVRDHGGAMSVQQALHTPGALLFHFSHEPRNAGDVPADGHVAISVGDGVHTMEARGRAYGVNEFANAGGRSFNYAGMIPGM